MIYSPSTYTINKGEIEKLLFRKQTGHEKHQNKERRRQKGFCTVNWCKNGPRIQTMKKS